jgi:hypothetical protein
VHEPAAPRTVGADDPLAGVVALPGVADAVDAARRACEELRWHEAYRRRWREVRAEAGIRSARGSAALDGARVPVDVVRALAVGAGGADASGAGPTSRGDGSAPAPDVAVATGALRAAVEVERLMPGLGARGAAVLPPLGQLAARLHAVVGRGWLADEDLGRLRTDRQPLDLRGLGAAPSGAEVAGRLDLLGRVLRSTGAPAVVVAAVLHGEVLTLRPFAAGNGLVARALSRLVLTSRGLDPTGSLVPEHAWSLAPNPYLSAAAGFATGTPDGLAGWIALCARGAVDGAREARDVADAVLAGRLSPAG